MPWRCVPSRALRGAAWRGVARRQPAAACRQRAAACSMPVCGPIRRCVVFPASPSLLLAPTLATARTSCDVPPSTQAIRDGNAHLAMSYDTVTAWSRKQTRMAEAEAEALPSALDRKGAGKVTKAMLQACCLPTLSSSPLSSPPLLSFPTAVGRGAPPPSHCQSCLVVRCLVPPLFSPKRLPSHHGHRRRRTASPSSSPARARRRAPWRRCGYLPPSRRSAARATSGCG